MPWMPIDEEDEWLIPAHAGKTFGCSTVGVEVGAHPRSRGENVTVAPDERARDGSSPLTRGKHLARARLDETRRLIPAHAGKTIVRQARQRALAAHPRSRGENVAAIRFAMASRGSSPLTRGKPSRRRMTRPTPRLIPAHAGKT